MNEFKDVEKNVEYLSTLMSNRFKRVEYDDVVSECYIFYVKMLERLQEKYDNPEDVHSIMMANFYIYCRRSLYRTFKKQYALIHVPESAFKTTNGIFSKMELLDLAKNFNNGTVLYMELGLDLSSLHRIDLDALLFDIRGILTEYEYIIFILRYVKGDTLREIGEATGKCYESIRGIIKKSITKLRKELKIVGR